MIRRSVLFIFVLMTVGEVIVRFDQRTAFFQSSRVETLANVYNVSIEKELLDQGKFPNNDSDVRVMLLGDSKLYGFGIRPEHSVSVRLKEKLRRSIGREDVYVLNLTRPGNNTFQNREVFEKYLDAFAPQIVILAYNHNDVYGDQSAKETPKSDAVKPPIGKAPDLTARDRATRAVVAAGSVLFKSSVFSFAMVKANMELKLAGFVIPGTEFDHLINRSHAPDYSGWIESQRHLTEMAKISRARGIQLIVYVVPELEMLARYSVLDGLDHYLMDFFGGLHVRCVNGIDSFRNRSGQNFALSRYDGHPNEEAHDIMASDLRDAVLKALAKDPKTCLPNVAECIES